MKIERACAAFSQSVGRLVSAVWRTELQLHFAEAFGTANPACEQRFDAVTMALLQALCHSLNVGQQIGIAREICHSHLCQSGLPSAQQFAWAT